MSIADAVLLGVVQGLTEFLPVSSSGHLVLFERFVDGFDQSNALLFNVTLHLGTLLSVIVYYRRDLAGLVRRLLSELHQFAAVLPEAGLESGAESGGG